MLKIIPLLILWVVNPILNRAMAADAPTAAAPAAASAATDATSASLLAGTSPTTTPALRETHFFDILLNLPGDYAYFGKTVFRLENWPYFAATAAGSAAGIATDQHTYDETRHAYLNNGAFHGFSNFFADKGKGDFQIYLGGALMLGGWAFSDEKFFRAGNQIVEVVLATGISTQILKHITGRQSPSSSTEEGGKWQWFTNPRVYQKHVSAHDAFPSGHVATAFATARVLDLNFSDQAWLPWVVYPFVGLIGVGMVAQQGHWYGDYPLSIALGWNWARSVTRNNDPVSGMRFADLDHWSLTSEGSRSLGLQWKGTF